MATRTNFEQAHKPSHLTIAAVTHSDRNHCQKQPMFPVCLTRDRTKQQTCGGHVRQPPMKQDTLNSRSNSQSPNHKAKSNGFHGMVSFGSSTQITTNPWNSLRHISFHDCISFFVHNVATGPGNVKYRCRDLTIEHHCLSICPLRFNPCGILLLAMLLRWLRLLVIHDDCL